MATIKLVLFALTLFCSIVLNSSLLKEKDNEEIQKLDKKNVKCTAGKFYSKGCRRCFCDENGKAICTPNKNCKLASKLPTSPDFIKTYSQTSLQNLKPLPHQAADCTPGATYRVNCNTCLCLANQNLLCNDLLCPSWDKVSKIKAQNMTGQNCTSKKEELDNLCISCSCTAQNALECKPKPNCIPAEFRRHKNDINPIDMLKGKSGKVVPCMSGMVYTRDCNSCYCHKSRALSCTLMHCLKRTEVERLRTLRLKLEKEEN